VVTLAALDAHRYLYLTAITEPADNVLRLVIAEGRVLADEVDGPAPPLTRGRPIVAAAESATYEVVFGDYVAYAVRNESYTVADPGEAFSGRAVGTYARSKFLDYVAAATIASPDHPGPHTHYGFNCLNHVVDVAAVSPPSVRALPPGAGAALPPAVLYDRDVPQQ
jgi:hypothetical protein